MSKVRDITLTPEIKALLRELKTTPHWAAVKEFMIEYTRFQRDLAFFISPMDPELKTKHIIHTSKCDGIVDFKNYIEGLKGNDA